MCPVCLGSAAAAIAGVVSTGGLAALFAKFRSKLRAWQNGTRSVSRTNPKEEPWEK